MIYNAYFEMATAVMLFILIIVYFWKKNLPVQSNRLYLNVLILLVIETCLSAAQCYYECRNDIMSSFAAYVVNSAAFTVGIIFIAMYNNYVLSLFHYKKKINAYCIISYSVIIIAILFVWTNPFTDLYFYVDETGTFRAGMARNIMNVLYLFIIFLTLYVAWDKGKKKNPGLLRLILIVDILITISEILGNILKMNMEVTM